MTIAILGDVHLRDDTPDKRIDDYTIKPIQKIEAVLEENDYVIFLGDLFNKPAFPLEYIDFLIDSLSPYKGRLYTILGNHDVHYRTLNLRKTTLGLLHKMGIVNLKLGHFKLDGYDFDVASVVPELKLPEKKSNILLGHFYLNNPLAPKESLTLEDLSEYDWVFLGHDHCPYEPTQFKDTIVYRNGSLMRVDAQGYNLDRDFITYTQIKENYVFENKILEIEPAVNVFSPEVFVEKPKNIKTICDLSNLDKLIANFKNNSNRDNRENMSTLNILKEINCPEDCVEYLRLLHEAAGIFF